MRNPVTSTLLAGRPAPDPHSEAVGHLLDTAVPTGSAIEALVVFPRPEATLTPRPLRRFVGCALLRIKDGTIWMLTAPGGAWTTRRLLTAASTLARVRGQAVDHARIEQRLRQVLGLPSLRLEEPRLDRLDPRQWAIVETALALVERAGPVDPTCAPLARITELRVASVESVLHEALSEALRTFREGLDATACRLATTDGRIAIAGYNYLAQRDHRLYRQQFAKTFPSLLPLAVSATPGSLGAELRAIVDSGLPAVRTLAQRWGVRPGVVRHLIARPLDQFGSRWAGRLRELAIVLDALAPEDVPDAEPAAWERLNHAVTVGARLFGRPVWESPSARAWLRKAIARYRRGTEAARARWLPDVETLSAIERLRQAMAEVLRGEAGAAATRDPAAIGEALERFIAQYVGRDLAQMARTFQLEQGRRDEEWRQQESRPQETANWPLLPAPFRSSDGTRTVHPLTTLGAMQTYGLFLGNCLAGPYRFRYGALLRFRQGKAFLVGLCDAQTGMPCSAAVLLITLEKDELDYRVRVQEHRGPRNGPPSPQCERAMEELKQHCRSAEVRAHLAQRARALAALELARGRELLAERAIAARDAFRDAVRAALGDRRYTELLEDALPHRRASLDAAG